MSGLPEPSLVILYVADPLASAAFYSALLKKEPVESSPTFVMLPLAGGTMLGLWARGTVLPAAAGAGGSEIAFAVDGTDTVRTLHAEWNKSGCGILQAPCEMDFGFTFVGADPDGHRLRVFAPKP